jgi:hypothetical protein
MTILIKEPHMYAQDQQDATLEQHTAALEDSIQTLLDLVGPTPVERKLFFRPIDILTTPAEWRLVVNAILGAQQQIETVRVGLAATNAAAVQIGG